MPPSIFDENYRDEVQRWAVEQVVKMHQGTGISVSEIISQARILVRYVLKEDDEK